MDFDEIFRFLQCTDETDRIEAKAASHGIGKSFLESVCAFANEPGLGGGYILLGVSEKEEGFEKEYIVTGIRNPDKLQQEIATQCRGAFNIPIRPNIKVVSYQSKTVILVGIEEANPYEKPLYLLKGGHEKGAFRRIGPTDQVCTRNDIDLLYQLRSQKKYEDLPVEKASMDDFDPHAIQLYRKMRENVHGGARELKYSDEDLLKSLDAICVEKGLQCPNIGGILLFGKQDSLDRLFPLRNRTDYILIEGREWMASPEEHYTALEICEPLITAIPRILSQIMNDIPQQFAMEEDGLRRKDNPIIPRNVIREALVNSLMHRDYQIPSPVQIIKYANRIEFRNCGYSLKPEEELGFPGSMPRNEKIAKVFHNIRFAEEKGTGMATMREEIKQVNLSVPLFESSRSSNTFVLTLLSHHLFDQRDIEWLKSLKDFNLSDENAKALIVLREMGAITNADYRTINGVDTLTASAQLRKLRNQNLISQKGKGSKTYYSPTQSILTPQVVSRPEELTPQVTSKPEELTPQVSIKDSFEKLDLPKNLQERIQKLTKKAKSGDLQAVLIELCSIQPINIHELSSILSRKPRYIRDYILKPMVRTGKIKLSFPDQPNHPRQAYYSPSTTTRVGANAPLG